MTARGTLALIAAGAVTLGCGGAGRGAPGWGLAGGVPPAAGDSVVVGTVAEVGAMPITQTVVQTPAGTSVAVVGALRSEIARLVGAEVRIWGPPTDHEPPAPRREVDVTGYEIVSVGGERPTVGALVGSTDDLRLAVGADTLRVLDAPPDLARRIGAKVWIVGPEEGGALRVKAYGILRAPQD